MSRRFYSGNYREDAKKAPQLEPPVNVGWIVGHFMPEGIRRTKDVEIKYWEFDAGPTGHETKESTVFECTLILEGQVKGRIDGETVQLSAGEYFVVPPRIENNLPEVAVTKCSGLTIKAPSLRCSKRVVAAI